MSATGPLVLPDDVMLVPVESLPEAVRAQVPHAAGEVAVTRPRSRQPSSLLDAAAADLLERFREPQTIVEAVLAYCRTTARPPQQTLEAAYPTLRRCIDAGLLVPAGSEHAARIEALREPGDAVAGCTVVPPVAGPRGRGGPRGPHG
jgi:eukaryotic-like serine/threonine-protein kinase